MRTLDRTEVHAMLLVVSDAVVAAVDRLTDADLAIGDGDHGIGMRRGFEAARKALEAEPDAGVDAALKAVGTAVMTNTGGASGAVFGTLFRAGSKAVEGRDGLDAAGLADLLLAGLEAVMKRGGVTTGQKTMVDALAPAAEAADARRDADVDVALAAAADAARAGAESTRDMIAATGKARSLGERSLGHVDPGAITTTIILDAMRDHAARAATQR